MTPRTVFLARLIGLSLIGMALSLLANGDLTRQAVSAIVPQPAFVLTFGMAFLALGLAMVLSHNLWSGGAAAIVVTVIGWLVLLRAAVLLFLPAAMLQQLYAATRFEQHVTIYAALVLVIGLYLTWAGFRSAAGPSPAA